MLLGKLIAEFLLLIWIYLLFTNLIFSVAITLTCQTCKQIFESSVKFGKHSCTPDTAANDDEAFECGICKKDFFSKKR